MQRRRVEICAVGPYQSVYFGIYANLIEQLSILQWSVEIPLQNRSKVYGLLRLIIEPHAQNVWPDDPKRLETVDRIARRHFASPQCENAASGSACNCSIVARCSLSRSAAASVGPLPVRSQTTLGGGPYIMLIMWKSESLGTMVKPWSAA